MALIPKVSKVFACLLLVFWLTACSSFSADNDEQDLAQAPATLAVLQPLNLSANDGPIKITTPIMLQAYRDMLPYVEADLLKAEIMVRAGFTAFWMQEQLFDEAVDAGDDAFDPDYTEVVELFTTVLEEYPDRKGNDEVYYQLARTYELMAEKHLSFDALTSLTDIYPDSERYLQAQYRRAEYLFSEQEYYEAQAAYEIVLSEETPYEENARYMYGWTLFKNGLFEESIENLIPILDDYVLEDSLENVPLDKLLLVEDIVRVVSLSLSYLQGALSLDAMFAKVGERPYEMLLYRELREFYVDRELYREAVDTSRYYIDRYPDKEVPVAFNRMVEIMIMAEFYDEVLGAKEDFVRWYAKEGEHHEKFDEETKQHLIEIGYVYIDELARYYHAQAIEERNSKGVASADTQASYEKAVFYYNKFLNDYPNDIHTPEKVYALADISMDNNDFDQALERYRQVAYEYPISLFSEDAAYNLIQVYSTRLESTPEDDEESRNAIKVMRNQEAVAFIGEYGNGKYAKPIRMMLINDAFDTKNFQQAIDSSREFLANPRVNTDPADNLTIATVIGHSYFEMGQFADAEAAYKEALATAKVGTKEYGELTDRVGASIYKQGEEAVASGDKEAGAAQFLRLAKEVPNSQFAKTAEYDAIAFLMQAEKWQEAIDVMKQYRNRHDKNRTDIEITSRMIVAYEGLEQLDLAAEELDNMSRTSKDSEQKRQSLYLSAEYFEKSGDTSRAINQYTRYVKQYPQPLELAVETRYHLSEMYGEQNNIVAQERWLEEIITAERKAGARSTDRVKYLSAYAKMQLMDEDIDAYNGVALTWPIKESLAKKRKMFDGLLKRNQEVLNYGFAEFSTQATFNIGNLFLELSDALTESERPPGFSELELEEYDFLLEEQSYPFADQAVSVHEENMKNAWKNQYTPWVDKSIQSLGKLLPTRYDKPIELSEYNRVIY